MFVMIPGDLIDKIDLHLSSLQRVWSEELSEMDEPF